MDGFVTSRLPINPNDTVLTGLLHARGPPFYYAVAVRSPSATAISVPCWATIKPPLHHGGLS
jgi:hypothetical protein